MREAYVYVAAMMWCWILGTASYYMIPTLGPFASRPRNFADLPSTNVTRIQNVLIDHRFELHADNIGEVVVGGIAGFASLHVGIVVSCWLMMRYYEQRVLEYIALGFLVPTIIATIYFGWHFIIDDVAGFLIGWLSVVLARATVYPHLMVVWRRRAGDAVHSHHTTKAE
jgi:membrane-associated phospholipid phosphatase